MNSNSCAQPSHERCFKVLNASCEGVRIDRVGVFNLANVPFMWFLYSLVKNLIIQSVVTSFPKVLYICACVCVCVWGGGWGYNMCLQNPLASTHVLTVMSRLQQVNFCSFSVMFPKEIIWLTQPNLFQIKSNINLVSWLHRASNNVENFFTTNWCT